MYGFSCSHSGVYPQNARVELNEEIWYQFKLSSIRGIPFLSYFLPFAYSSNNNNICLPQDIVEYERDDENDGTLMKHILNHRLHDNHKHGDSECRYFVTVEFEMVDIYLKIHILSHRFMVRTLFRM